MSRLIPSLLRWLLAWMRAAIPALAKGRPSRRNRTEQTPPAVPACEQDAQGLGALRDALRGIKLFGLAVVLLFFGAFGAFATLAPLASATIAPGTVSPEGHRRTVQHLEGGIIRSLAVKDGDRVAAGDSLLVLEGVQARASDAALRAQKRRLVALRGRLLAEQSGQETIELPQWLLAEQADPEVQEILATQLDLFKSRRSALARQEDILQARIRQLREEIAGRREQIASQDQALGLLRQEIGDLDDLVRKGLALRPRLLALQRELAGIGGQRADNVARIAQAEQAIGAAELEIIALHDRRRTEVDDALDQVRAELAEVEKELEASADVVRRTVVRAPVDGVVVEMRFSTEGGVVRPGEPILDIVPERAELLVDARIGLNDIDSVRAGQRAEILLSAYGRREAPRLSGVVRTVSADRLIEPESASAYFLARVAIDPAELGGLGPEVAVLPGMPAEVMIVTGERTLLDYLLDPILRNVARGMRET